MKKKIYAIIIILVAAAFIVVPLMRGGNVEDEEETKSVFLFKENLKMVHGDKVELLMLVPSKEAKKVELYYDNKKLETWNQPGDTLKYAFSSEITPVGTRSIQLVTTYQDGKTKKDLRYIRVLSDITPEQLTIEIIESFPHNPLSFTQGLEFYKGKLFEGTGLLGRSLVVEVDLETGEQSKERIYGLDGTHFGEGITILNDVIYQLTWQNQKCITYTLGEHIIPKADFYYPGEGWGLTNDGKSLIMSDGTERITFRNPEDFTVQRSIEVYNDLGPITALNELEFIDGKIYANIWQSTKIVVIDPETGKVIQEIDASAAVASGKGASGEVLNGIAHNDISGKTYITGKNWEKLLQVRFVKPIV